MIEEDMLASEYASIGKSADVSLWYICEIMILKQMFLTALNTNTDTILTRVQLN